MNLHKTAKDRRKELSLSQTELAKMVGCRVASISYMESGKTKSINLPIKCILAMGGKIKVEF